MIYDWDTPDGVCYNVSLGAWHNYKDDEDLNAYEEQTYLGPAYELGLEISYDIDLDNMPQEMRDTLAANNLEVPDGIHCITLMYGVELGISPAQKLTWNEVRCYDIEYTEETIDGFPEEIITPDGQKIDIEHAEIGMEVSRLLHLRVSLPISSYTGTPDTAEELPKPEESNDEIYRRLVDQLIESCQSDPAGRMCALAAKIVDMIEYRSEHNFDLTSVFPPEVLADLEDE